MEKHETFSTTADVGIRIQGNGCEGLFQSAVKGLYLLYFGAQCKNTTNRAYDIHPFEFRGDSCENVLVNLLLEVIYLFQMENKITIDINFEEANETYIKADLLTTPCDLKPEMEIKSVTYHNLRVKDKNGIKSAEVIFDI
jgi:SHS2 domain-containing protein